MRARLTTPSPSVDDILQLLDCPPDFRSACRVSCDFSIPKAFICFPKDYLMQALDNYLSWDVGYYAGSLSNLKAALCHGGLLMKTDTSSDGNQVVEESREMGWFDGDDVCVFRTYREAWRHSTNNISIGRFDRAVLVIKLRPGAFTEQGAGLGTNRKGSHVLYGMLVSGNGYHSQTILSSLSPSFPPLCAPECPYAFSCFEFLQFLSWPMSIFEDSGFRCYCPHCYPANWPSVMEVAGEKYIVPRGWCRFGLKVSELVARYSNIWENWANAYHGTTPQNALSIIQHGQLLINGDVTIEGKTVVTRSSRDKKQSKYFVSPHVCYASHPWYSQIIRFRKVWGQQYYGQVVLAMKVRPGVYQKQRETEGGAKEIFDDYSVIPKNEIEWYSNRRNSVVPYGVLFRVFDDQEKFEIERLAGDRESGES